MNCQHENIVTRRFVDNNEVAMWNCAECKMRFEPASALDKAFQDGVKYERKEQHMTQKDTTRMARDDLDVLWNRALQESVKAGEHFTRYHFAALVAAAERESCAKVCDEVAYERWPNAPILHGANSCAKAIRARGEK